jgi:hypothetical protein
MTSNASRARARSAPAWTPDQPLRADATDEQTSERLEELRKHEAVGGSVYALHRAAVQLARECAAAVRAAAPPAGEPEVWIPPTRCPECGGEGTHENAFDGQCHSLWMHEAIYLFHHKQPERGGKWRPLYLAPVPSRPTDAPPQDELEPWCTAFTHHFDALLNDGRCRCGKAVTSRPTGEQE